MKSKNFWMVTGIAVLAIVLLGWRSFSNWSGGTASSDVPCINPALPIPPDLHIHPHLAIKVNGESVTVPANIGLGVGCEHALHTHDGSGTIHIEPNFPQDFTLGQFFGVWGTTFARDGYEMAMTVNGTPNSEYEKLVLRDKQEIVIEYRAKAK